MTTTPKPRAISLLFLGLLFFVSIAEAQLYPIGPFSGVTSESFDSIAPGFLTSPLTIMNGAASVQTTDSIGCSSPLNHAFGLGDSSANALGNCAAPADGTNFLGIESGVGPGTMDVIFTNTIKAFGGYWGAVSDSNYMATITFTFLDAGSQQIGTPQAVSYFRASGDGMLEWHGWFSSTPFKTVRITSSNSTLVGDSFRAGASGFSLFTSITRQNTTENVLQGNGTPGVIYGVQSSTNLSATNWPTLGTVKADATGALHFTNSSISPQRFYRLKSS